MTNARQEPIPSGSSGAAVKLAELLAEVDAGAGAGRRSEGAADPEPVASTTAAPSGEPSSSPGLSSEPVPPEPEPAPAAEPALAPASPSRRARHRHSHPNRHDRLRAGAFGAALVVLIAAIPVLGVVGQRIINQTHDGRVFNSVHDPNAPGYEALIDSTPTALLVQVDRAGKATSATLLALGAGDRGGSVIFLPLDTAVAHPAVGVDRLSGAYLLGGVGLLRAQVSQLLNVGIDEAITVDDAKLAELVRPAGALTLENPDSVTSASGASFASGHLILKPEQVGPFLAARNEGESDLNRLVRQKLLWLAWLKALGGDHAGRLPGEVSAGTGRFLRTLARGTVQVDTLAVTQESTTSQAGPALMIDPQAELTQVTKAVPFPRSPSPGARISVRLLNGTKPGPIPATITDALTRGGAELTSLGNAQSFGRAKTHIDYYAPASKGRAEVLRSALGVGQVTYVPRDDQTVEVTVTLGQDVSSAGSSAPITTAGGPGG